MVILPWLLRLFKIWVIVQVERGRIVRGTLRPLGIAPMMERTDRHYRYDAFDDKRTLLYTEMVHARHLVRRPRQAASIRLTGTSNIPASGEIPKNQRTQK